MNNLDINVTKLNSIFDVPNDTVLHIEDIAKLVNMHEESVRRWCRSGKLPSYNFGNKYIVVGSDFKSFMKSSRVKSRWEQMLDG